MENLIPILGILTGMVVPIAVFLWLYHDAKHKRQTVLEIAKHIDDPVAFLGIVQARTSFGPLDNYFNLIF